MRYVFHSSPECGNLSKCFDCVSSCGLWNFKDPFQLSQQTIWFWSCSYLASKMCFCSGSYHL